MAKRRRRKQTIKAEEKPLRECTCAEIAEHLQSRDQVVFVMAWTEMHDDSEGVVIDQCAYASHVFDLINKLIQRAKKLREEENGLIEIEGDED